MADDNDPSTESHPEASTPRRRRRGRGGRRRRKASSAPPASTEVVNDLEESNDPEESSEPEESTEPVDISDNGFLELGLSETLVTRIARIGFEVPTDIQAALIPPALEGHDCLGQARTGTGKTAAFALPMIETLERDAGLQAIILVPTRELALQVGEQIKRFTPRNGPRSLIVYGGTRVSSDLKRLEGGVEVVVGTPGRVLDLIRRGALKLEAAKLAVLDEVDRMLDIGFRDDIRAILRKVHKDAQMIFVSATMSDEIRRLTQVFMEDPVDLNVSEDKLTVDQVRQEYVTVDQPDKFQALVAFLKEDQPPLAIVFTRTKRSAQNVARKLKTRGIACAEIHGDLAQRKRASVLKSLRAGDLKVLVATDLASRGLDVLDVSHVVNYDITEDPAVYVHRVGRTARMGREGYALTFVTREQGKELTAIEMLINKEIARRAPLT